MRRDPTISRYAASALSPARRSDDMRRLRTERFDVLIIGGGVTGAGAAVDAASRGLSVALVEARDLASGTSSRSSKLIHGGLRYLEQLEFGLVSEALRERDLLASRLAPHLVRPVPILVPLASEHRGLSKLAGRTWLRGYYGAGVALYDGFAAGARLLYRTIGGPPRGLPHHRHLSRAGIRRRFPSLRTDVLTGGIEYHDGQVDDARFVTALARTAASLGAAVVTSTRVVGLERDAREVIGARVHDAETGKEFLVSARTVVAATGVWSDDISTLLGIPAGVTTPDTLAGVALGRGGGSAGQPAAMPRTPGAALPFRAGLRVRASKGVHLVVPRSAITGDAGLILRTPSSVLFVLPWGGHWIIGTTDTDWNLDRAHPAASARDIEYLLSQVNQWLERPLSPSDIEGVYAGLRPLLAGEDEETSKLSREHAVLEPMLGLMLVAGGKYTTYRVMAADVIDKVVRRLDPGRAGPASRTEQLPLVGADGYPGMWMNRADLARRHGIPAGVVEHLLERYGTLIVELLRLLDERPELGRPLAGAPEYLAAEIVYAASHEGALHLDDVLARRTRISIETTHRGTESARHAAELMGGVLGWDEATVEREVGAYLARVDAERRSQRMPDDLAADAARHGAPDFRGPDGAQPVSSGDGAMPPFREV